MTEIKKTSGSWHTPIIGVYCPHCEEWEDYFEQIIYENDYPFAPCENANEDQLSHITLTCKDENCGKEFGLDMLQY